MIMWEKNGRKSAYSPFCTLIIIRGDVSFYTCKKTVEFLKIYMLIAIEISRDAQNFVS